MRRVVILGVAVAMGLAGCVAPGPGDTGHEDLSNEAILARDRARLAANLPMLVRQARTACAGGYVLELYAPPKLVWEEVRVDRIKTSHRALFWVVRVPEGPKSAIRVKVPLAMQRPGWFAERWEGGAWQDLPLMPPVPPMHSNTEDAPLTIPPAELAEDLVLPTPVGYPILAVMEVPQPGRYRISYPEFTAVINGTPCSLAPAVWTVDLR